MSKNDLADNFFNDIVLMHSEPEISAIHYALFTGRSDCLPPSWVLCEEVITAVRNLDTETQRDILLRLNKRRETLKIAAAQQAVDDAAARAIRVDARQTPEDEEKNKQYTYRKKTISTTAVKNFFEGRKSSDDDHSN